MVLLLLKTKLRLRDFFSKALLKFIVFPNDKLIQFVLMPIIKAEIVVEDEKKLFKMSSERGDGGFGHTDKNK